MSLGNNTYHDEMTLADGIHIPYSFEYANATEREAATGFVAGDVGKFAHQISDHTIWILTSTTPTWVSIAGQGTSMVGISPNDTSPSYLENQTSGTTNKIILTVENEGGNEVLNFNIGSDVFDKSADDLDDVPDSSTYGKVKLTSLTTGDVDHTKITNRGTNTHSQIDSHIGSTSNPHSVTASQISLGNVTNDAQLKRAANDFTTFTEKTSVVGGDIILIEDSANSYNKKKVQVSSLNTIVFGNHFYQASSDSESSTTSTTYINKLTLTTGTVNIGKYYIGYYFEQKSSQTNILNYGQMTVDTVQVAESIFRPSSTSQYEARSGFYIANFATAAAHTITIDYKIDANTTSIKRARLVFWRVE